MTAYSWALQGFNHSLLVTQNRITYWSICDEKKNLIFVIIN